jgi:hypothetical protein
MNRQTLRPEMTNPSETDLAAMDSLWRDYDKTHIQNVSQMSIFIVHAWEDWAIEHFHPQLNPVVANG